MKKPSNNRNENPYQETVEQPLLTLPEFPMLTLNSVESLDGAVLSYELSFNLPGDNAHRKSFDSLQAAMSEYTSLIWGQKHQGVNGE
jgi:hypothetical protein